MDKLNSLTSKELLDLFNKVSGQSVKRFADRAAGIKRILGLMSDPSRKQKIEALLGLASTTVAVIEVPERLPTVGEVLAAGMEASAAQQGVPALRDPKPKPKPKASDAKPINDKLVAIAGRVVRKENVAKVVKGESLWGSVAAPPSDKDRLKGAHAKLNLNYPAKETVKPMREGTKRHKLVSLMRSKGVTVEEVMAMFGLTEGQAVYKLRDLHYMSGHGLEVRNGRVFVTDKG